MAATDETLVWLCAQKFHEQLLAMVQQEFESRNTLAGDAAADLSGSSREEKERVRMLGIVKFLAELGKRGLVQETVLHLCIRELLQKPHCGSGPNAPAPSTSTSASGTSGSGACQPLAPRHSGGSLADSSSTPAARTSSLFADRTAAAVNSNSNNNASAASSASNTSRVQAQQASVNAKSNAKEREQAASKAGGRAGHDHPEHKETSKQAPAPNARPSAAVIDQPEEAPLSSEEMRLICNNIECVCNLLKLVGPMLDTTKAKACFFLAPTHA